MDIFYQDSSEALDTASHKIFIDRGAVATENG